MRVGVVVALESSLAISLSMTMPSPSSFYFDIATDTRNDYK